jgi:hypothetical protein
MRRSREVTIAIAALLAACAAAPALGGTPSVPPGNPCLKNNGNPCNGNNGNLGAQGNAGHEHVKTSKNPPPINITMPAVTDRGVYISQIGDNNVASVVQTAPNAYTSIAQNGDTNNADVAQTGTGTGYIAATQTGDQNFARLQQSGSGQNVLYATQTGTGNWMWSNQQALGALFNGAELTQTGNYNDMELDQSGSGNLAVLTQEGDSDGMTATQLGTGNRLVWTQQGSNLSDLQITQTGGSLPTGQLMVTQTNIGNGNGH